LGSLSDIDADIDGSELFQPDVDSMLDITVPDSKSLAAPPTPQGGKIQLSSGAEEADYNLGLKYASQ